MEIYTDGSTNYIKSATDGSGAFPISIHSGSSEVVHIDDGNIWFKTGVKDKDGDLGSAGQVLSSTGSKVDWITLPSDVNTTYLLKAQQVSGSNNNPNLFLDASSGTDDTIRLIGGTNVTITRDNDGQITFTAQNDDTQLSSEQVEDIVGAMFSNNTETRISATYDDNGGGHGKINLVVDDQSSDNNTTYSISAVNGDNSDEEKIRLSGNDGSNDDVVLEAGTGLSIARSGDKITFTNTDTGSGITYNNAGSDRVITSHDASTIHAETNMTYNDTNGLYVDNHIQATGRIRPSVGNAGDKGIYWPTDPGGGAGDAAWIRYYSESGENMRLEVGTSNDADDDIQLTAGRVHLNTATTVTKNLQPWVNNSYDLGTSSNRWNNLYINDLQLSNESRKDTGGNDVDGTWGNYTIQEGEDDLFLINRRSGKKYKFLLKEVD